MSAAALLAARMCADAGGGSRLGCIGVLLGGAFGVECVGAMWIVHSFLRERGAKGGRLIPPRAFAPAPSGHDLRMGFYPRLPPESTRSPRRTSAGDEGRRPPCTPLVMRRGPARR